MGDGQQFSLRWNNYLRHITCAFDSLRSDEDLVDVTLSCEGKKIRAHRMLLSACSTYFRDLFKENPCQHPVIIFRNVKFEDLSALVDFMYQGEVNVLQDQLSSFLTTAELLAVQGLSDGNGRDSEMENKETEAPDSPPVPAEPEVQLNSSHLLKQLAGGSNASDVSSPVSFFPVDQSSNSPPSSKRRKWGSGVPSKNSNLATDRDREIPEPRERRRATVPMSSKPLSKAVDPIEIIPVVPSLKLEMPDYDDQDGSSCSYSDSNQAIGPGDAMSAMSQLLAHGTSATPDGKQEHADMYSSNSRDDSLQHSTDSLSAADISQILSKPGPSGENQSQDSLQAMHLLRTHGLLTRSSNRFTGNGSDQPFSCGICHKVFKHPISLQLHKGLHTGQTQCHICQKVFSRRYDKKTHLYRIHGITL